MKRIVITITLALLTGVASAEESVLVCNGQVSNFGKVQSQRMNVVITKTNGQVSKVVVDEPMKMTYTLEKVDIGTNGEHAYKQLIIENERIILRTENPKNVANGYPLAFHIIIENTGAYKNDFLFMPASGQCVTRDKVF